MKTKRYLQILGTVILISMGTQQGTAQIYPYPYLSEGVSTLLTHWMLTSGEIRRTVSYLDSIEQRTLHTSSADVAAFSLERIDRFSDMPRSADRRMEQFVRNRPNSPLVPFAWMERGLAALEIEDWNAAEAALTAAAITAEENAVLRADSSYLDVAHISMYWLGAAQANQGLYEKAITSLKKCVEQQRDGEFTGRALYAIGQVYEQNADPTQAASTFADIRKNYSHTSTVIAARIREAQNYLKIRQPERAMDALVGIDAQIQLHEAGDTVRQVRQLFADNVQQELLFIRAQAASLRGKYQATYDSCVVLLAKYPKSEYRWFVELQAGFSALHLNKPDTALSHFARILEAVTSDAEVLRQQALLYHAVALKQLGRKADAEKAFEALAYQSGYPFQSQALIEVGIVAYEAGEYDKAEKNFNKADKESRDALTSVRANVLLGAALIELHDFSKAATVYTRTEQLAEKASDAVLPNKDRYLAESRLKRGICLVMSNQTRGAISALTDFIGNHRTDIRIDEATFWLAESMYKADLFKNAQELFEEIVNKYSASIRREEAMYGLAWTYFRQRSFSKSIDAFGDLLKAFPKSKYSTDAMVRRGDAYYISKQYSAAADQYKAAFKRSASSSEGQYAGYQAGQALYRANDMQGALQHLKSFVVTQPMSRLADDALFLVGWIHFQQKDYATAIVEFQTVIDAYPTSDHAVKALYTIGDAQYNQENVDAAMQTYRRVISGYPTHPLASEAAKSMQITYLGMGRNAEALEIADELINANPQSIVAEEFGFRKAEIFYSGKNFSSAAAELEAYIKKYPGSEKADEAIYLLGKTYLTMNDESQAKSAFTTLEKKYTDSKFIVASKLDLAMFYANSANSQAADSIYSSIVQKHANDTASATMAGFERATLARVNGDSVKSQRLYAQLADRYPGTEYGDQARYQVAMQYKRMGDYDSARIQLGIMVRTAQQPLIIANGLYDIGELFFRQGRIDEAIPIYTRVREDFAGYEDWYTFSLLALGECYEKKSDFEAAKEAYGIVAELRPEDDFGKTAIARIKRISKVRK